MKYFLVRRNYQKQLNLAIFYVCLHTQINVYKIIFTNKNGLLRGIASKPKLAQQHIIALNGCYCGRFFLLCHILFQNSIILVEISYLKFSIYFRFGRSFIHICLYEVMLISTLLQAKTINCILRTNYMSSDTDTQTQQNVGNTLKFSYLYVVSFTFIWFAWLFN